MKNLDRVVTLIRELDFEGCIDALDKIDNFEMCAIIIDHMFELDCDRAIAYAEIY